MASFSSMLDSNDAAAIRAYVIKRAHDEKSQTQQLTKSTADHSKTN